ncbi:division/cell wall cluster transcriptional repressor MraZ [Candidatus Gottesmanbacteria bacterium]|nr:division/cell wall cluster transcriptional repressor MraZ [Candidatus Gottesmanbacteria bacterium]
MLLGTYQPNLIGKNRLALPAKLRKEIRGDRLVLAVGFEECILGFEEKKWQEATAADLARPLSEREGRDLRRKMFSQAGVVELDSQGRFVVPEGLVETGELKGEIIVIGAGDHFEIWSKTRWEEYRRSITGKG